MLWEVFAQNLLWFFKNLFFPEFWLIEPIFRSIEIAIKNFGQPPSVLIDAQLILDQSKHFRSIEPNFWSIKNCIKSFSNLIFTCSNLLFKTFSPYTTRSRLQLNFFVASSILFVRFFSPKASKSFIPFLLHLFTCFMH